MIGETISHYKILEKIGEGGMGIVYKAEDTKLKRIVALKFLPSNALGTEEEKARFIREAQAAASLNHPNIATIYEIDEVEGEIFIAMEYIDGQTLKEKINSGPLKIKEAVKIACQVADGLNAAHEKGITHRDIKSANVMLTEKGQAKIMDFGLAKMAARTGLTKEGTTLGTIAYMSPEQSRGEHVDHRSDIWSLGVVLYEMVSGQLPFKGEYETAMVYSILNVDPEPLTALRTGVPIALDGIVAKAMAKEPDARYQHVDEVPVDLKAIDLKSIDTSKILTTTITEKAAQQPSRWRRAVPWSVSALMVVVTAFVVGFIIWNLKPQPTLPPQPVTRVYIPLSPGEDWAPSGAGHRLKISPDGKHLVYSSTSGEGQKLNLRDMDKIDVTPLEGTEGGIHPFFSPDNRWVGFFADNRWLKILLLPDGNPVTLYDVRETHRGGSWGDDNTIIFGRTGSGLMRIAAFGGTPEELTKPEIEQGELAHRWPEMLPGSKAVLFTIWRGTVDSSSIALLSLETNERQTLIKSGSDARYSPTGHIFYTRAGRIIAVPFDLEKLMVTGGEMTVLNNVYVGGGGPAHFSFSINGSLVYRLGGEAGTVGRTPVWVDRKGITKPMTAERRQYQFPRISPDGRWVAFFIDEVGNQNIWIHDVERGTQTPFTFEGSYNGYPSWTPNGERLTFASNRDGIYNLYWKRADGIGQAELILSDELGQYGNSWSPDNKLAFYEINPTTQRDISVFNMQDSTKSPFLNTSANERSPMFSPDGNWLAYISDKSGQFEVYIKPYPGPGREWQVSTGGGTEPMWAPDGQELFYRSGDKMMAVSFQSEPTLKLGTPKELFEGQYSISTVTPAYDIHPDGDRFLMVTTGTAEESTTSQINVVLNWFEELKSLFNTGNNR